MDTVSAHIYDSQPPFPGGLFDTSRIHVMFHVRGHIPNKPGPYPGIRASDGIPFFAWKQMCPTIPNPDRRAFNPRIICT